MCFVRPPVRLSPPPRKPRDVRDRFENIGPRTGDRQVAADHRCRRCRHHGRRALRVGNRRGSNGRDRVDDGRLPSENVHRISGHDGHRVVGRCQRYRVRLTVR